MQIAERIFYFTPVKPILISKLSRIGFISRTHGYKGNLNCITDISKPEKLIKLDFMFIMINGLPVPFCIEELEVNGTDFQVKFEEINSDVEGKKFLGKELFAEKMKESKKNVLMSWKDVQGYTATDESFGEMGTITEVAEYPMQYIGKCIINEKEVLFPLNDDVVTEVDDEAKTISLDLPLGLLDIYLE